MSGRRHFLQAALTAPAALWAQNGKRQPRPPDVHVVRFSSVRQEGVITYEGIVKVTGERPVAGLLLIFEFFATTKMLLSIQKIEVEPALMQPGEERSLHLQGNDVPRAVSFRLSAQDGSGRDLRLSGEGPYPLD
jgi:hypothetical protein